MRTNADIMKVWRKSILAYIKDVWKMTPQPLKKGVKDNLPSEDYKPEHFEDFEKGKHLTWQQWLFFREIDDALSGGKLIINPVINAGLTVSKMQSVFLSVASGHGTGKSTNESIVILWGLTCFIDCQIGCTAPTSDQIHDVLWKEVAKWHRRMPQRLQDCFEVQSQYVVVKERPESWWARARTARKEAPEALAGLHGEVVIILVDEASGVPEEIFEVAQGALTGKFVIFIMVSNPTRLEGFFFDSHHNPDSMFRQLSFSSEESPIVEKDFCSRIESQYGKDSPQYKVRVQGKFPEAEEDQLISNTLFEEATNRQIQRSAVYTRCLGIDVARYGGDRTPFVDRQGPYIDLLRVRMDQDLVASANDAVQLINESYREGNPFDFVMIDIIGLGAGLYDILIDRQKNGDIPDTTKIIGVNVSETADEETEHQNKRVELWYRLKAFMATGYIGPKFKKDCCSIKIIPPDAKGRNRLEPKENTRDRSGQSPDLGDAACLTMYIRNNLRKREGTSRNRFDQAGESSDLSGGALG